MKGKRKVIKPKFIPKLPPPPTFQIDKEIEAEVISTYTSLVRLYAQDLEDAIRDEKTYMIDYYTTQYNSRAKSLKYLQARFDNE